MFGALWTDWLFVGLLSWLAIWVGISFKHPTQKRAFEHLMQQKLAVSAGLVLSFFFMIALLDSLHLPSAYTIEGNDTVLDYLLKPLDESQEQTFSAPLALTAYTTEIAFKNGHYHTVYPKLKYPAPTLKTEAERDAFIFKQICLAFLCSLLGFSVLLLRKKNALQLAIGLTLGVLIFWVVLLYGLSRELHVFGTGKIGQDIFYYSIKSVRTGLVIGILTTLFTLPFALFFGVAAGYFGGWVDDAIQYVYTTLSSIPGVLLITASVLSMQTFIANHPNWFSTLNQQADARLLALCVILGVTSWTSLCRLLRAEALKLRHIDYVLAARVLGVSAFQILRRHLLPNLAHIVLITLVLDFSYLILAEAVLTYVGVGVSPMTISWGNMINSARLELAREPVVWWPVLAAFVMMFILVLASNVFADAVEEAWNPRAAE